MTKGPVRIDVLFVSELPLWPLDQGYRVHDCRMAKALMEMGASVRVATLHRTAPEAPRWLRWILADWPTPTR